MTYKYKIYCKQRNQYFADGTEFESLQECTNQLRSYHLADHDEYQLNEMSLYDLCDVFEWEIHNSQMGDIIELTK